MSHAVSPTARAASLPLPAPAAASPQGSNALPPSLPAKSPNVTLISYPGAPLVAALQKPGAAPATKLDHKQVTQRLGDGFAPVNIAVFERVWPGNAKGATHGIDVFKDAKVEKFCKASAAEVREALAKVNPQEQAAPTAAQLDLAMAGIAAFAGAKAHYLLAGWNERGLGQADGVCVLAHNPDSKQVMVIKIFYYAE